MCTLQEIYDASNNLEVGVASAVRCSHRQIEYASKFSSCRVDLQLEERDLPIQTQIAKIESQWMTDYHYYFDQLSQFLTADFINLFWQVHPFIKPHAYITKRQR